MSHAEAMTDDDLVAATSAAMTKMTKTAASLDVKEFGILSSECRRRGINLYNRGHGPIRPEVGDCNAEEE